VTSRPTDIREFTFAGHSIQVFPADEGSWQVAVDGRKIPASGSTPYEAWALGVAESYRQGKRPTAPDPRERG